MRLGVLFGHFLHDILKSTRELFDLSFFIFQIFTISVPQSLHEGVKKPINILGKKFKVIKKIHNMHGS